MKRTPLEKADRVRRGRARRVPLERRDRDARPLHGVARASSARAITTRAQRVDCARRAVRGDPRGALARRIRPSSTAAPAESRAQAPRRLQLDCRHVSDLARRAARRIAAAGKAARAARHRIAKFASQSDVDEAVSASWGRRGSRSIPSRSFRSTSSPHREQTSSDARACPGRTGEEPPQLPRGKGANGGLQPAAFTRCLLLRIAVPEENAAPKEVAAPVARGRPPQHRGRCRRRLHGTGAGRSVPRARPLPQGAQSASRVNLARRPDAGLPSFRRKDPFDLFELRESATRARSTRRG